MAGYDEAADDGQAVLITRSSLTGQVTALRTAAGYVSLPGRAGLDVGEVVLPVLFLVGLVFLRRFVKWLLAAMPKVVVIGVPPLVFALTLLVLATGSPVRPDPGPPPPTSTLPPAPSRFVSEHDAAVAGNLTVTLTGPISHRWPNTAPAWIRGLPWTSCRSRSNRSNTTRRRPAATWT